MLPQNELPRNLLVRISVIGMEFGAFVVVGGVVKRVGGDMRESLSTDAASYSASDLGGTEFSSEAFIVWMKRDPLTQFCRWSSGHPF